MAQEEIREAIIHFELYRCLKNCITSESFKDLQFIDIIPEQPVITKAADLVLKAIIGGSSANFLVIEVKRRTRNGFLIFGDEAEKQAKGYAKNLHAIYYALTDGHSLRLFKASNNEVVGNYEFSVDEENTKILLKGLESLHSNGTNLPFQTIKNPVKEIEERSFGVTQSLIELFNGLNGKSTITVEDHATPKGHAKWLKVGSKRFLSLQLFDNCLVISLKESKDAIGFPDPEQEMKNLSKISGFQFIADKELISKNFTWAYTKNIAAEEPDLQQLKRELGDWVLKVAEQAHDN